ncbi:MAG: carboxypeptidase-like regulatory domain-containing protein, partial [Sphingobacterium sp.]|nr:carboxypeptidase-like regulatory domain-containing protein [Sphingobacterium sp.]
MKISLNPFLQNGKEGLSLHGPTPGTRRTVFDGNNKSPYLSRPLSRSLMKLNLITLLLGLGLSQVDASTYAQQVTLKRQKTSLEAILKDFEKQSGYTFFYKKTDVTPVKGLNVDVKNMPLNQALNQVLKDSNFTFEYFDKTIVIKKGRELQSQAVPRELPQSVLKVVEANIQQSVRGRVLDENGKPIKGASVREKSDSRKSVATQEDGTFTMPITSLNEILVISYLGYQTKEIKASLNQNEMVIRLSTNDQKVDEVVVTGITQRKKDSFTGATASFTGEELKMVNNQNVVASLRALDPSFIQIENNALGSNPNMLPKIELRGQTSIPTSSLKNEFSTDPNQPLFILDGFETSLRTIMDLDMNIIQSATILKDAASTAIYGSRASNGVVVIETIKPKPGKVQLSYSADMQVQAPDLSSYNMMDAAEKLEFERLSGRFNANQNIVSQQMKLDQLYNDR